jgi:acetyl esterase/lipase
MARATSQPSSSTQTATTSKPSTRATRSLAIETFVYKTVEACPLSVDVYPAEASGPAPVVVCIHGGCLIYGGRSEIASGGAGVLRERLGERGYTQVSVDYRLAPETKLAGIVEDVQDAWRWVHEELPRFYEVDTSRVGVLGRSAGGYLTLMAGFCVEPRPAALVAFYGYGDIMWYLEPSAFYRSTQPLLTTEEASKLVGTAPLSETLDGARDSFYRHCRQQGTWIQHVTGLEPVTEAESLEPFRPIRNVSGAYPPTLLIHGTSDTDVPHEESAAMADALKAEGAIGELLSLDSVEHGFDFALTSADLSAEEPSAEARAIDRVLTFVDTWLK